MMPWLLVGLAGIVLALAAVAATGRLGQMPEPPVEDEWIDPTQPGEAGPREQENGGEPTTGAVAASSPAEDSVAGSATPGADPSDVSLRDTG